MAMETASPSFKGPLMLTLCLQGQTTGRSQQLRATWTQVGSYD